MFNSDTIIFVDEGVVHEVYDSYINESDALIRCICSADGWFVEVERVFGILPVENLAAIQVGLEKIRKARRGIRPEGVTHIDEIKKIHEQEGS